MPETYALVTRKNRFHVLDKAATPEDLNYMLVEGIDKWGVCVRHKKRLYPIAAVNLNSDDEVDPDLHGLENSYDSAVRIVCRELQHGHDYGEFDHVTDAAKWPVVSVTQWRTLLRSGSHTYWTREDYAI